MIEPLAFVTFLGTQTAMTVTVIMISITTAATICIGRKKREIDRNVCSRIERAGVFFCYLLKIGDVTSL